MPESLHCRSCRSVHQATRPRFQRRVRFAMASAWEWRTMRTRLWLGAGASSRSGRGPSQRDAPLPRRHAASSHDSPWLGTLGAQSGHSRGSSRYSDRPEMPVLLFSAPGPIRTPDLQVRSLTTGCTQPICTHPSPGRTRSATDRRGVRWAEMGWVRAPLGHSACAALPAPTQPRPAPRGRTRPQR
jgi:hypothetical protein